MADHNQPTNTTGYSAVLTNLKDRMIDLARWFDPATTTPTNLPANSFRFNAATLAIEKWSGTAWSAVARVLSTTNATALTSLGFSTFVQTLIASASALGFRNLILAAPATNVLHNADFSVMQLSKWNYQTGLTFTDTAPAFPVDRWALYSAISGKLISWTRGVSNSGNPNGTLVLPTDAIFSTTTSAILRQRIPFQALTQLAGKQCCFSIGLTDTNLVTAVAKLAYIGGSTIATSSVLSGGTMVFTMPATILNDYGLGLELTITLTYASATKNTVISQPMLHAGATPATFEARNDIGICKEYYEPITELIVSGYAGAAGQDHRFAYPIGYKFGGNANLEMIGSPASSSQRTNCTYGEMTLTAGYRSLFLRVQNTAIGAWLLNLGTQAPYNPCGVGIRAKFETA